jgi:hypothetical protein
VGQKKKLRWMSAYGLVILTPASLVRSSSCVMPLNYRTAGPRQPSMRPSYEWHVFPQPYLMS